MDAPAWFIPDRDPSGFYPLQNYLPRPPENVLAEYIAAWTAPGDLVIDPFASTPVVAHLAQQMGRRVIAVENNPLWTWLARVMAALPPLAEMNAALARLADTLKDDVPLHVHIRQLYATPCATCRALTPADYFVWASGVGPIRRHYTCVHCGETYEGPATEEDLKRAAAFDAHGFHYHFAFDRVAPPENPHSDRIRKMLDVYTPRNLYALVTLTVKIDSLFHGAREQDTLLLLLLHLLDRGTSFYTDPAPGAPARLTAHKQYVELNLWAEMERTVSAMADASSRLRVQATETAVEVLQGDSTRAYIGRGSAKWLARTLPEHVAALAIGAPPPRRVAIWALSYFWGAWVLGRTTVESLIPALDPHKADPGWDRRWYLELFTGAMGSLARLLHMNGRAALFFHDTSHQTVETALLAAAGARLEPDLFLFQPRLGDFPRREFDSIPGDYRISFLRGEDEPLKIVSESELAARIRTAALAAGREVLTRRAEPLAYSWVHHAALTRAARERTLPQVMSTNFKTGPALFLSAAIREGLTEGYAQDLDHYAAADQFVWLRQGTPGALLPVEPPLFDRVDEAVYSALSAGVSIPHRELEDAIYRQFPGDLTPEAGLIELCAAAYAEPDAGAGGAEGGAWHWRNVDAAAEQERTLDLLGRLGRRLEYRIGRSAPFDLTWEADGEIAHGFIWRTRARFNDLAQIESSPGRGHLVIPETLVALALAKVRRLPLLAQAFNEAGWDFVRVSCVEKLLEQETLERHDLILISGLAPPLAKEQTQLELF